jgi:hypothetical protein
MLFNWQVGGMDGARSHQLLLPCLILLLLLARSDMHAAPAAPLQVAYVNVAITSAWAPREERVFYLFSVYAEAGGPRLECIPFRAHNPGLVCSRLVNQHKSSPWRIAVTLRNAASFTIQPSAYGVFRFGMQVGP